jgi:decaprenyl-phosphate phosphoribosyltransferase
MNPWLRLLRPQQWIKNVFVFAGLFFAGKFGNPDAWAITVTAAGCFLLAACVVYIINDLRDIEEDRLHPSKRNRSVASGRITVLQATLLASVLAAVVVYLMTLLPYECAVVIVLYITLNLLYTLYLKHLAIIDIFFIAFCYVLRVLMGCYAILVTVSPWIILATFLLALFLGFGKRYHEVGLEGYAKSKANLQQYNRDLLDRLVVISGGAALMTYAIYAAEVAERTGRVEIIYTVGFVAFGLFRYLQSIYVYRQGGEPEMVILRDKLQLLNLALWLSTTMAVMF